MANLTQCGCGWHSTPHMTWSRKGAFPTKMTTDLPVYTSQINTVVDLAFGKGEVSVKSVEVLWALSFTVGTNGEAKSGEQDMQVRNGFTDHNGILVTVDLQNADCNLDAQGISRPCPLANVP